MVKLLDVIHFFLESARTSSQNRLHKQQETEQRSY